MSDHDTQDHDAARLAWASAELLRRRLDALKTCSMLPGSFDKRFVRDVSNLAAAGQPLTDRQGLQVLRLAWRYRRQMPKALVPDVNPDDPLSGTFTGFQSRLVAAPTHRDMIHG